MGIIKNIYWKPTFIWIIDYVRVMNPIITESIGIRTVSYSTNKTDLSYYMYLKNVRYQVRAHMIPNPNHPEFAHDWNENKHFDMAQRFVKRGGRNGPFLGTSECAAFVKDCQFGEGESYYDTLPGDINYGVMFHSYTFPDEAIKNDEKGKLISHFWTPVMQPGGYISFLRPEECPSKKFIRKMDLTEFVLKDESGNPMEVM